MKQRICLTVWQGISSRNLILLIYISILLGLHAVYKLNGKKIYLKNTLSANASFPKGEGLINDLILQKFSAHSIKIDDELKLNYKKHNGGIADASFHISYNDKKGLLNLPNNDFCQMVDQRSFNIDGSGSP